MLGGNLLSEGNLHLGGNLLSEGNLHLGGNLHSRGNLMLGGNLYVGGKPPFKGPQGNLILGGNLNLEPMHQPSGQMHLQCPIRGTFLSQGNPLFSGGIILKVYNNLILLKGLIYILLMDKMFTPMGKHQIQLIILKTHLVILRSHMFLNPPRIMFTLVSNNPMQEDPLVKIIHLTQFTVLLVSLCHTSITLG
jgi:hypothetical protein